MPRLPLAGLEGSRTLHIRPLEPSTEFYPLGGIHRKHDELRDVAAGDAVASTRPQRSSPSYKSQGDDFGNRTSISGMMHVVRSGTLLTIGQILAWIAVLFRLYVRVKVVREPGWDDACLLLAAVSSYSRTQPINIV
jgi:hypothetical protein